MLVLGIETSCDETGIALFDDRRGLLAQALHSQAEMHASYGGVVPELASRDHLQRLLPLLSDTLRRAQFRLSDLDAIAVTEGPGLAGALLAGAAVARSLGLALGIPTVGIHHLEGHLLSPLLSSPAPDFPFIALLVSGGHTQLMTVNGVGQYQLLGETLDDAAGEAFDKVAKMLALPYPGGPALSRLADGGKAQRFRFPRPMSQSGDLNFSFSGLKTAVRLAAQRVPLNQENRRDLAAGFQTAVVSILASKAASAMQLTGLTRLVVAGGVGANRLLREELGKIAAAQNFSVYYPPVELCTDNGAMIALAGAKRLSSQKSLLAAPFTVRPRWDLDSLKPVACV